MNSIEMNVIEIKGLKNQFGDLVVHQDLDFVVKQGAIQAIVGSSGCGKTTLLRSILMLHTPSKGEIKVFGINILRASHEETSKIQHNWGIAFQQNALFSSLTVLENVIYPLKELTNIPKELYQDIARLKISLVGLPPESAKLLPAELSGGMRKRAAVARAIALDPQLLILDEPTAGLDPSSAGELDGLILKLRETLSLTVLIVTHDIDTLKRVPDTVAFLGEKKVLANLPLPDLRQQTHPLIHDYFTGPRFNMVN